MKHYVYWLIGGGIVLIIGIIILVVGFALNGWSFGTDWETQTYTAQEEVVETQFEVCAGTAEIEFYDGDKVEITYPVSDKFTYKVTENAHVLKTTVSNKIHWFSWLAYRDMPKTVIKIPKMSAPSLKINLSAGVLKIAEGTYGKVDLTVSAGTLKAGKLTCYAFSLELSAGSANIDGVNALTAKINLSAGSANVNDAQCTTYDIDLSAGSLNLDIVGEKSDFKIAVDKSAGSCNLEDYTGANFSKNLDIDLSAGSVNVSFK